MKKRLSETFDLGSKGRNAPNTDPTPPPARLLLGLERQEMIQNDLKLQLSLLGVSFAQCKYFIPDQWMNSFWSVLFVQSFVQIVSVLLFSLCSSELSEEAERVENISTDVTGC